MNRLAGVYLTIVAWSLAGCGKHAHDEHGHGGHSHGEHAAHGEDEEEPTLAITRWTDKYELFVELPAPQPGRPVAYHAHVTRLSDFLAVTEGTFRVRFKTPTGVASEATQSGTKRPGIFVFESPAPSAGTYALEMSYEYGGTTDVFDCGAVTVSDPPTAAAPGAEGPITFLKESQWKLPFATAWAAERPMAREIELSATVEPAASDQLTVSAPTGGLFFHNAGVVLAEGSRVNKGDILGTIAPTVAGDDFGRLQLAVEEARLGREQRQREIARVQPLVAQGLVPERRLIELRNDVETYSAQLRSAGGRLARVVTPGGQGALVIKATLDGVVSQVLVSNGGPVEAGNPLVRIGGTESFWLRARFVAKAPGDLRGATPTSIRMQDGTTIPLEPLGARFLSASPSIDIDSQLATWLVEVAPSAAGAAPVDGLLGLRAGMTVVLAVRVGEAQSLLAVPRGAVVQINTRPYVFVQTDGEHFERRAVTVGQHEGDWVHISRGVALGERVVTLGGFDIHLASLMGTIESHRH